MIALRAFDSARPRRPHRRLGAAAGSARTPTASAARTSNARPAGEGHEALHAYLGSFGKEQLAALSRIGHTSGLDAAAGALLALARREYSRSTAAGAGRLGVHLAH
jgi:hypothetical protein